MYLKTFEICVLKYMRLLIFFCTRTGMASNLKKTKVKLDLLNDINMLLMVEKHCVKNVQIRSYFWSVFSCIRTEYGDLRSKSPYSVRIQENTDQK